MYTCTCDNCVHAHRRPCNNYFVKHPSPDPFQKTHHCYIVVYSVNSGFHISTISSITTQYTYMKLKLSSLYIFNQKSCTDNTIYHLPLYAYPDVKQSYTTKTEYPRSDLIYSHIYFYRRYNYSVFQNILYFTLSGCVDLLRAGTSTPYILHSCVRQDGKVTQV